MKFHFNLFSEHTSVVGVAFGDAHVRALELSGSSGSAQVTAFAEAALPKGVLDSDGKVDVDGLAHVLEGMYTKPAKGKFTTTDVAINLPEARCFVRVIHVSPMTDNEIDAAVPFEAESYIPVPIDQVYLDWQRLGETDGRVALLLMASPKVFVDQLLAAVSKAHLTAVAVEVESAALARVLIPAGDVHSVLVADMKAASTDLIVIERGAIQFTSTVPFGGNNLTDALAKGLEVPPKRAEEIKTEVGFGNTADYPNLKTLLVPVMSSLIAEMKQVMTFHDQHAAERINKIVLVGGGARLKNLSELLQGELSVGGDVAVEVGDPTVNVHVELPAGLAADALLPYTAALGLAMRGVSL